MQKNQIVVILMLISKLCITLLMLVSPLLYGYFINEVIIGENFGKMLGVIVVCLVQFILESIFYAQFMYADNKIKNLLRIDLKKRLLTIYSKMSMQEYAKQNKGDIRNVIEEDTIKLQELYSESINYMFSLVSIVCLLLIMGIMDWRLTFWSILMIVCSFLLTKGVGENVKRISAQYRNGFGELEDAIHYSLLNWKEIKANNLEKQAEDQVILKWKQIAIFSIKKTFYQYIAVALSFVNLMMITRVSIYFLGGILIFNGKTTVAIMLAFINCYQRLNTEMTRITELSVKLKGDDAQIEKVIDVLKKEITRKPNIEVKGDITLNDVSYRYGENSSLILNNITLTVPQNSHVAIVGKSGSGKSTLAKLMLGILKPVSGSICIGNADISEISENALFRSISAVMQEPQFFNLSIAENLRMAKKNSTEEELDSVCMQANIYDFIQNLPDKYNTIIGERGIKLSGGQRQRLAIARILLKNPDIIIFDEATSSLDSDNEKAIIKAIKNISDNKTIITIAHRFAAIMESEYIFMIQDGAVIEQGRTKEMVNQNENLARLFQLTQGY